MLGFRVLISSLEYYEHYILFKFIAIDDLKIIVFFIFKYGGGIVQYEK